MTAYDPVFEIPPPLPRGPHRLSADEVAASQRARLLHAVVTVVGEDGLERATLAAILRAAGVSRATFYALFDDKQDCLIAAYDRYTQVLLERVTARLPAPDDWEAFIAAGVTAVLETLDSDRVAARVMLVEMTAAGPTLERTALGTRLLAQLIAARHADIRAQTPALGAIPDAVFLGWVRGARELLKESLQTAPDMPLIGLAPTLIFWLRATILGAAAATRAR